MGYFKTKIASLSRRGSLELNFYRVHIIYFVLTILLSSIIMYGSNINGNSDDAEATFQLRYIDAIFLCAGAMTNTGSNTVNLNNLTGFQQSMLCVLSMMGTLSVTANATIWVRRHFFRKHMKVFLNDSKAAREIVGGVDQEKGTLGSLAAGPIHSVTSVIPRLPREDTSQKIHSGASRDPKSHHEIGHGGIPYPWEWNIGRKMWPKRTTPSSLIPEKLHHYLSFQPLFDQKVRPPTSMHDLNLTISRVAFTPLANERPKSLVVWNTERWASSCGCCLSTFAFGLDWPW